MTGLASDRTSSSLAEGASLRNVSYSGDPRIDGLISTYAWDSNSLTFSFPTSYAFYPSGYSSQNEPLGNFGELNVVQKAAAKAAFAHVSTFSGLAFVEVAPSVGYQNVDIALGNSDIPTTAWAYYPWYNTYPSGGDIWFGRTSDYTDPKKGTYSGFTFLHELGHALGLKHGHEAPALPAAFDSHEFSIMTYRSYIGSPGQYYTNGDYDGPQTMMMFDIAALQHMYGASFATNSSATTYTFSATTGEMFINGVGQGAPGSGLGGSQNRVFLTIWDGGGIDTYNFSNYSQSQLIDLNPGKWSKFSSEQLADLGGGNYARANVFNALQYQGDLRSLIENAIGGSGADTIIGNVAANDLNGGVGVDMIYGGGGADRLIGGPDGDHLWGGAGADFHDGGAGADIDYARYDDADYGSLVLSLANPLSNTGVAAGDTYSGVEGLVGGAGADYIFGNGGNNYLFGSGGGDHIWGGAGADAHFGGDDAGTDYARYDDANYGDLTIRLDFSSGNTGAAAGDSYNGIEGLVGGLGNDVIVGNGQANFLFGGGGADFIDGLGGSDYLNGGAGVDRFRMSTTLSHNNVDTVADFARGADKILLAGSIFSAVGAVLDASEFNIGLGTEANDFILYNPGIGALYYDSNGSADGGIVQFAVVAVNTVLDASDFQVV